MIFHEIWHSMCCIDTLTDDVQTSASVLIQHVWYNTIVRLTSVVDRQVGSTATFGALVVGLLSLFFCVTSRSSNSTLSQISASRYLAKPRHAGLDAALIWLVQFATDCTASIPLQPYGYRE